MKNSALRRGTVVLLLTAALLLPGLAEAGNPGRTVRIEPAPGLAALWSFLTGLASLQEENRWQIDPNGGDSTVDNGWLIDPNGGDSTVDNRWLIDPDG